MIESPASLFALAERVAVGGLEALGAAIWIGEETPGRAWLVAGKKTGVLAGFAGEHEDWLAQVQPEGRALFRSWLVEARKDPETGPVEYRLSRPGMRSVWVRHRLLEPTDATRENGEHVVGVLTVIDEQKRLEAECLAASEREKANLGQELHDDVCQILTGLNFLLGLIQKKTVPAVPELKATFVDLRHQLDAGMARTRALAHGLTPLRLVDEDLSSALAELARQSRQRFGVKLVTAIAPGLPRHAPDRALHVYRIMQEAVANAVKHGRATRLRLSASCDGECIEVYLSDNGAGFPSSVSTKGGIGLGIMRSRARELCGMLKIEPGRRGGVGVRLTYSVAAATGDSAQR